MLAGVGALPTTRYESAKADAGRLEGFLKHRSQGYLKISFADSEGWVGVGALMALVLIARPSGLTGGREFPVGWLRR